jgi:hypothetical protein
MKNPNHVNGQLDMGKTVHVPLGGVLIPDRVTQAHRYSSSGDSARPQ